MNLFESLFKEQKGQISQSQLFKCEYPPVSFLPSDCRHLGLWEKPNN